MLRKIHTIDKNGKKVMFLYVLNKISKNTKYTWNIDV